jgi:CBS domain-containing protein
MTVLHASRHLGSQGRLGRRPIVEVMTAPAPILSDDVPLVEAAATMVRLGVHHAAVVDRHGRCLGVLDDQMAVSRWSADRSSTARQTVACALPAIPAIIAANAVVSQAAQLMRTARVDALAVTDQRDRPVGVLTRSDLIALLSESG